MLTFIQSPVGPLSEYQFKLGYDAGVWSWDSKNQSLTLLSYKIQIGKNGKIEEVEIPIRYYNLLWALHVNPDFEKAVQRVRIWNLDYLPAPLGFTSYSKLINHCTLIAESERNEIQCNHKI